jgi:hypothetical protein
MIRHPIKGRRKIKEKKRKEKKRRRKEEKLGECGEGKAFLCQKGKLGI